MKIVTQTMRLELALQAVVAGRPRKPYEACALCDALPGALCRNVFNPSETYTAGHLQPVEPRC
jgi:hypothetical protein